LRLGRTAELWRRSRLRQVTSGQYSPAASCAGIYLAQYSYSASSNFFLTWFSTYLVKYRHMDFIKVGFYATLPFLAGFCGVPFSGFLSDLLLRRDMSLAVPRNSWSRRPW
jgi:hypothetical protein